MLYRRFVSFWMEKYLGDEGNRLYFSYESFTHDQSGPQEAARLATFLDEGIKASAIEWVMSSMEHSADAEGSQPLDAFLKQGLSPEQSIDRAVEEASKYMINLEDVPCLWKEMVYETVQSSGGYEETGRRQLLQQDEEESNNNARLKEEDWISPEQGRTKQHDNRRRLQEEEETSDNFTFEGGNWIPAERPYTPENLAAMSQMLLELMNRWSRHQRLLSILSVYHREVNSAYLESTGQLEGAIKERDRLAKNNNNPEQPQAQQPQPQVQTPPKQEGTPSTISFHIIQASPLGLEGGEIASNWLTGLFEPSTDVAYMDNWPESPIQQSGRDATIDSTIVTKTNSLDLLTMYKLIRRELCWTRKDFTPSFIACLRYLAALS